MLFVCQVGNQGNRRTIHHLDETIQRSRGKLHVARVNLFPFRLEQPADAGPDHGIRNQARLGPIYGFCGNGAHCGLQFLMPRNIQTGLGGNNKPVAIVTFAYKL